jgi:hypothetical protein
MAQDIPNIIYGTQEDYKKLYYSNPDAALKVPVTISPGWGVLKQGTVLARNTSALTTGNQGKLFPYDPSLAVTGAENAPGRSYLVADQTTGTAVCNVTINDSYRFSIGDDIIICDSDLEANSDNGGAITAIDRTTYTNYAVITFTTNTGDTFTTTKFAHAMLEGCFDAVGILEKSVDTGIGLNSKGALATLILGNCVLYSGMLLNFDSGAATDLSGSTFGQYTYIP